MSVHKRPPLWVGPAHATPIGPPLPLSPLDLSLLHSRIDLLYVYDAAAHADAVTLPKLIRSLGDALSEYNCLAGRLINNADGTKAIRRSDDGVMLTAADADFAVDSFMPKGEVRNGLFSYDTTCISPSLLTPLPSQPTGALVSIQVTQMHCGGWCIGISVYHGVMDGESVFTFMQSWSARNRAVSTQFKPSHERNAIIELAEHRAIDEARGPAYQNFTAQWTPIPSSVNAHSTPTAETAQSQSTTSMPPLSLSPPSSPEISGVPPASTTLASTISSPYNLKIFHFTRNDIQRMLQAPSVATTRRATSLMTQSAPIQAHGNSTVSSAPSTPINHSRPAMLRSYSLPANSAHLTASGTDYKHHFDIVAALIWKCVMRARYGHLIDPTQLVSAATSPAVSPVTSPIVSPINSPPSSPRSSSAAAAPTHSAAPSVLPNLHSRTTPPVSPTTVSSLGIAYNGRNRFEPPLSDVFCGNVTFFARVPVSLSQLIRGDIIQLAHAIRDTLNAQVDGIQRETAALLAAHFRAHPDIRLRPAYHTSQQDLIILSYYKYRIYAVDFGTGPPSFVGFIGTDLHRQEGLSAIMNTQASDGSVDCAICLKQDEMNRFESDLLLRRYRRPTTDDSAADAATDAPWVKDLSGGFNKLDMNDKQQ